MRVDDAIKNFREKDVTNALKPLIENDEPYLLWVISTIEVAIKSGLYDIVKREVNNEHI